MIIRESNGKSFFLKYISWHGNHFYPQYSIPLYDSGSLLPPKGSSSSISSDGSDTLLHVGHTQNQTEKTGMQETYPSSGASASGKWKEGGILLSQTSLFHLARIPHSILSSPQCLPMRIPLHRPQNPLPPSFRLFFFFATLPKHSSGGICDQRRRAAAAAANVGDSSLSSAGILPFPRPPPKPIPPSPAP